MSFHIILIQLYNVVRNIFDYMAIVDKKNRDFLVKKNGMEKSSSDIFSVRIFQTCTHLNTKHCVIFNYFIQSKHQNK